MIARHPLQRTTPEAQGISSSAILGFIEEAEQTIHELHSLMLLRHGAVVAEGWWEPFGPDDPHMLFSLSKSFTSTGAGFAIAEGLFSLDDSVISFFPDDLPEHVSENLASMRVRHLLSMSTGHADDTLGVVLHEQNWARAFLAHPVEYTPGTHFLYNSGATYMVSAIVQRVAGMTLLEYLRPRLMEPLSIRDATWETSPSGVNTGGWGLKIKTRDIAKFGQLYLQDGKWGGTQLLPEGWVAEATRSHISNAPADAIDWGQGYGFQFWRCRFGAYRGDGAFGQFCVVMPEQDAVLAITSGLMDMQAVLNLVWKYLLPAMGPVALSEDDTAQTRLANKLASLSLIPPQGEHSSPISSRESGHKFVFEPNDQKFEAITVRWGDEQDSVMLWVNGEVYQVACGHGRWVKGRTAFNTSIGRLGSASTVVQQPVAASGAWTADNTYVACLYFYETPFRLTITCRFGDGSVVVDQKMNVSFDPSGRPSLTAKRVD